jgi:hypothetical protein
LGSLILREELNVKVFESRVTRRLHGLKMDEIIADRRKQNNQVKEDEMDRVCSTHGEK